MPIPSFSTRNAALEASTSKAAPARAARASIAIRLVFPVLGFFVIGCQPAMHSRQSVTPAWSTVAGFVSGGPSRIRVGEYTVAGLRASAATRHWPLMDSRTLSHRYGFEVQKDGGRQQGVQCVLITIRGDEARDRITLDCTVEGEESWRIALSGRADFDGTVTGGSRHYRVRAQEPGDARIGGRTKARTGYHVLDSDSPVAVVEPGSDGEPWIDPSLDDSGQGVVAATVVALLLGHELGRGDR